MTPHSPYLPDAADRGRFLPADEQLAYKADGVASWKPHYASNQQHLDDRCRLRYDEFVASADLAFGAFTPAMESSGKLPPSLCQPIMAKASKAACSNTRLST